MYCSNDVLCLVASVLLVFFFFFLKDAAPPDISPLPLPAALPICLVGGGRTSDGARPAGSVAATRPQPTRTRGRRFAYTERTVSNAQRIRHTAVSGWSPNSPATWAAQPRMPRCRRVAATARRTCSAAGTSEDCRVETNRASARTASNESDISHLHRASPCERHGR